MSETRTYLRELVAGHESFVRDCGAVIARDVEGDEEYAANDLIEMAAMEGLEFDERAVREAEWFRGLARREARANYYEHSHEESE